ncbi:hypothetical protein MN608_07820 [Microdochium nivale]|nr:hypothetical protein MN608_07820 [Microdochium nivale]
MPGQIIAPIPIAPMRKLRLGQPLMDLTSLNTSFATPSPVRSIQEQDWHVPAPPPPSPVSFRPAHFDRSLPMFH